jgi:hypothetical protein
MIAELETSLSSDSLNRRQQHSTTLCYLDPTIMQAYTIDEHYDVREAGET